MYQRIEFPLFFLSEVGGSLAISRDSCYSDYRVKCCICNAHNSKTVTFMCLVFESFHECTDSRIVYMFTKLYMYNDRPRCVLINESRSSVESGFVGRDSAEDQRNEEGNQSEVQAACSRFPCNNILNLIHSALFEVVSIPTND